MKEADWGTAGMFWAGLIGSAVTNTFLPVLVGSVARWLFLVYRNRAGRTE